MTSLFDVTYAHSLCTLILGFSQYMIFDRHASLYVSTLLHNRQGKSQHLITTHASLHQCKRLNCGTNSAADRIQNTLQQLIHGIDGVRNIAAC